MEHLQQQRLYCDKHLMLYPPLCVSAYCLFSFHQHCSRYPDFIPRILCVLSGWRVHRVNSHPFIFNSFLQLAISDFFSDFRFGFIELQCFLLLTLPLYKADGIYLEQFNHRPQSKLSTATNNQFISMSAQTLR